MIFRQETLEAIAAGKVTVAFRRWRRPTVRTGGTLKTAVGVLAIDAVDRIALENITVKDAVAAGFPNVAALTMDLSKRREGSLYRIRFRMAGPDPRIALRNRARLNADELAQLRDRLNRWDRSSRAGPWTRRFLTLIERSPGVRAANLAKTAGMETQPFKANVRKLKELGLTESLEVGYRLSPRGIAVLRVLRQPSSHQSG